MSPLVEQVTHVDVRAQSADGTVRIMVSGTAGVRVRIKPGSLEKHTATSLARALESAIERAFRGFRRAGNHVLRRYLDDEIVAQLQVSHIGQRMKPFFDAIAAINADGAGNLRYVAISWSGDNIKAVIDSSALKLAESELTTEIHSAISTMLSAYTGEVHKLYISLVESEFSREYDHDR